MDNVLFCILYFDSGASSAVGREDFGSWGMHTAAFLAIHLWLFTFSSCIRSSPTPCFQTDVPVAARVSSAASVSDHSIDKTTVTRICVG